MLHNTLIIFSLFILSHLSFSQEVSFTEIKNDEHVLRKIFVDGEEAGFISFYKKLDPESVFNMHIGHVDYASVVWTLSRIKIEERFRRHGYASLLVETMLDDARKADVEEIILTAKPSSLDITLDTLIAFYKRFKATLIEENSLFGAFMCIHLAATNGKIGE
jgi:GNAT superfamily N-acetyltransferase